MIHGRAEPHAAADRGRITAQSRMRYRWQTSARCSNRVAVEIHRPCAGKRGRIGPDVSPAFTGNL